MTFRPEHLRDDIPLLEDTVYLNTGSSGPSPRRVRDTTVDALGAHSRAHAHGEPYANERSTAEETREAFASLLSTASDRLALTSNTTEGINITADCTNWSPEDKIVTTALEHPAGVLPWKRVSEVYGTEVATVPAIDDRTGIDSDEYKQAVKDATLVCLSSVSWYGVSLPVEELVGIAHDADASVVVDAAQSVGAKDTNVQDWGVEYVAGTAHKWLLGPWGVGFLYVSPGAPVEAQTRVGYKSAPEPNESAELHEDPRRFEVSTSSPALYAGATEAADMNTEIGAETVETRISSLVSILENGLGDRHLSSGGGLVRFDDPSPQETVERLRDSGIVVRSLPNGDLRASVHAFNTEEDLERLLEAL